MFPPFQGSKWVIEFPVFLQYNKDVLVYWKHNKNTKELAGKKRVRKNENLQKMS